jgi:hypothetical protein
MTPPDGTLCGSGDGLPAVEFAYHPTCPIKEPLCARCAATMRWLQAHAERIGNTTRAVQQILGHKAASSSLIYLRENDKLRGVKALNSALKKSSKLG